MIITNVNIYWFSGHKYSDSTSYGHSATSICKEVDVICGLQFNKKLVAPVLYVKKY